MARCVCAPYNIIEVTINKGDKPITVQDVCRRCQAFKEVWVTSNLVVPNKMVKSETTGAVTYLVVHH